jgi:membrane fusion protein (multidrug efflux system)
MSELLARERREGGGGVARDPRLDRETVLAGEATKPVVSHGTAGEDASPQAARSRLGRLLMIGGVVLVLVASAVLWFRGGRYVSTDDAYVQAPKLAVSTDVSGLVTSISVREGESVEAGQILFEIDPRAFEIALDNATANLAQVKLNIDAMRAEYQVLESNVAAEEALVAINQIEYERAAALQRDDTVSRDTLDTARATLRNSKSSLESLRHAVAEQLVRLGGRADIRPEDHPLYLSAKAGVDEAQRQLDHATVRAPFDGVVTQVDSLQPGMYLVAQTAALTSAASIGLVDLDRVWVTANMKETDLTFVTPGNPVTIHADTFPGIVWMGSVEAISPASGSEFSILPPQNATGNFAKVVQRIPVRIRIEADAGHATLRSGMSVTVEIDTGHRRSLADLL